MDCAAPHLAPLSGFTLLLRGTGALFRVEGAQLTRRDTHALTISQAGAGAAPRALNIFAQRDRQHKSNAMLRRIGREPNRAFAPGRNAHAPRSHRHPRGSAPFDSRGGNKRSSRSAICAGVNGLGSTSLNESASYLPHRARVSRT
jgi:hypothetical protein